MDKETMTNQIMKAVEEATSSLFDQIDDLEQQKAIVVAQVEDQQKVMDGLEYKLRATIAALDTTKQQLATSEDMYNAVRVELQDTYDDLTGKLNIANQRIDELQTVIDTITPLIKQIYDLTEQS